MLSKINTVYSKNKQLKKSLNKESVVENLIDTWQNANLKITSWLSLEFNDIWKLNIISETRQSWDSRRYTKVYLIYEKKFSYLFQESTKS